MKNKRHGYNQQGTEGINYLFIHFRAAARHVNHGHGNVNGCDQVKEQEIKQIGVVDQVENYKNRRG
jgi:hypothetical protein